jgi:hypothetical protein
VDGSRTILVRKRDGDLEAFCPLKLSRAVWRAMLSTFGRYGDARDLACAVGIYLSAAGGGCVSSAAVLEMTVKVLRRAGFADAAAAMEVHRAWRRACRRRLRVVGASGRARPWDTAALAAFARRHWHVSRATARILAGRLEAEAIACGAEAISGEVLTDMMNELVSQYGLADAVPVGRRAARQSPAGGNRPGEGKPHGQEHR